MRATDVLVIFTTVLFFFFSFFLKKYLSFSLEVKYVFIIIEVVCEHRSERKTWRLRGPMMDDHVNHF